MSLMQKAVIVLMIVVCAFVNAAALPVNSIEYLEKVSLQVLDDTANGQQAPFILILAEQADVEKAARFVQHIQKAEAVFTVLQQTAQQSQPAVTKELDRAGVTYSTFTLVNAIRVYGDRTLVFQMASRKDISAIVPDHAFRAALEEPDNFLPVTAAPSAVEWNIQKVNADDLWDLGITGAGLVYGNADTGIDWTHPALQNHYRGWSEMGANHNYYWWDAAHEDLSGDSANDCGFSSPVPCDDYGHGTHTTGIGVGGEGSNQVGVAPGAKWIGCRNMEDGYGSPSTYLECLDFMLAPWDLNHENPRPDLHADVIGNSYTCPVSEGCGDKHILQTAVNNLRAAGIFMSVSAGNEGSNCSTIVDPPAIEDGVITIGATTSTDVIASLSSRGPITVDGSNLRKPDLVAPGINVRSTYPGGVYASMSGTSMASPHVAGVVALLWQRFPVLKGNIDATESILENSALHLTSSQCGDGSSDVPNNVYGYGRVDALAAYLAAAQLPVIYFPLLMR